MSAKILSASALLAVAGLVLATSLVAQSDNKIAFVQIASEQQRLRYLATAKIWSDPGDVTPEMVLAGRPLKQAQGLEAALGGQPLQCSFAKPGKDLGGATPKFACITPGGRTIRVKYSDGSKDGNREIFSGVAAAKLLWALGFISDPIYPITIDCRDCPSDPMSGTAHVPDARTWQRSNRNSTVWSWSRATSLTRDGAGARSMRPSRICPRVRCGRDSARTSTR